MRKYVLPTVTLVELRVQEAVLAPCKSAVEVGPVAGQATLVTSCAQGYVSCASNGS